MNYLLLLILGTFLCSCSFKSSGGDDSGGEETNIEALKTMDSDGDLITDHVEVAQGLDRFVANFPTVKVNFLQDYSIDIKFEDESSFSIDTVTGRSNPDFKYRVGDIFLRTNSKKSAAHIGRFSGVSWGTITQKDFSWVEYPKVDKSFFHNKAHEYSLNIGKTVLETNITLENSLKLAENPLYKTIKDLEVAFYYYSYSKEKYVQIHTQVVDRAFQVGTREEFSIDIINPPSELLDDNYFRKGEFIISEIKDFYIPSIKMKYSDLLKSIKAKSIPVYRITPLDTELNYVAVDKEGGLFNSILEKLYSNKFEVKNNQLIRIEQFSNNLKEFKYLNELQGLDKEGRWFVMTNKLKNHYLEHQYQVGDSITLSYLTGDELSKNTSESVFGMKREIDSGDTYTQYVLGNLGQNSKVEFQIVAVANKGVRLNSEQGVFAFRPPRCRNCTGTNWSVRAEYRKNTFTNYEESASFMSLTDIADSVEVLINNTVLDLNDLIEKNYLIVELKNEEDKSYFTFSFSEISKYGILKTGSENIIQLKLKARNVIHSGYGLQLDNVTGSRINPLEHAPQIVWEQSWAAKLPIAETSWNFSSYASRLPWGKPAPNGHIITRGKKTKHFDGIVVDVISTITNYIN
jgi:hypothetical protein